MDHTKIGGGHWSDVTGRAPPSLGVNRGLPFPRWNPAGSTATPWKEFQRPRGGWGSCLDRGAGLRGQPPPPGALRGLPTSALPSLASALFWPGPSLPLPKKAPGTQESSAFFTFHITRTYAMFDTCKNFKWINTCLKVKYVRPILPYLSFNTVT